MKNLYLFIASLICCHLLAQPTITRNELPVIGHVETVFKSSGVNTFNPGAAGANVTWNFSQLDTSLGSFKQKAVRSDTIFLGMGEFPPSVNIAFETQGVFNLKNYIYAELSTTKLQVHGKQSIGLEVLQDPEQILAFPFTYNSQFTDVFHDYDTVRYGRTTVKGDGYGILNLPGATYTNVLRINITENYTDYGDDYDFDGQPDDSLMYEGQYYRWYKPGNVGVLLEYSSLRKYGLLNNQKIYVDSLKHLVFTGKVFTGVDDVESNVALQVYPNPAKNWLSVSAALPIESAELTDISGKLLLRESFNEPTGIFDLSGLAAGTYYLHVTTTGNYRKTVKVLRM